MSRRSHREANLSVDETSVEAIAEFDISVSPSDAIPLQELAQSDRANSESEKEPLERELGLRAERDDIEITPEAPLVVVAADPSSQVELPAEEGDGEAIFDSGSEPGTIAGMSYLTAGLVAGSSVGLLALAAGGGGSSSSGGSPAPMAADDAFSIAEDVSLNGNVLADNGNGADSGGGNLTVSPGTFATAQGGSVTVSENGDFSYTPRQDFNGSDSFEYTLNSSDGRSDIGTVTVAVGASNDAPMLTTGPITISEGGTAAVTTDIINVIDADNSPDELQVTVSNVGGGQFESTAVPGTAVTGFTQQQIDDGLIVFFHDGSENAPVFTVTASDGNTTTTAQTPDNSGSFTRVNDDPIAADDAFSTDEDTAFTTASVLGNDSDPDSNDTLTITDVDTTGTVGTVTNNGDGTFDYDPNDQFESLVAGESATDSFSYTVSDGNGGSDTATVTITINGASEPVAAIDLASLNGNNGFRLDGEAADDFSGRSVSSAGDVNGDGFDDLIIGAYFADPNGNIQSGSSYVVFGQPGGFNDTQDLSALDGNNGFRLDGVAFNDRSGVSVSSAGDINGDGFDDLIIGADGADPNGSFSGSSYVVFGQAGGFAARQSLANLDGNNGFRLDGAAQINDSGRSVSSAGDVNGDGFDDLIIGAPSADFNGSISGSTYVVFGQAAGFSATQNLSDLDGNNGFRLDGVASFDDSGSSVSSAGDINGDGFDDLIVGAPDSDPNGDAGQSGSSYVVFGQAGGFSATQNLADLDGNNGFRLDGVATRDFSGSSVSSAGDINGDGFDDLIIGALVADPNDNIDSGSSYVVFGQAGGFSAVQSLAALDGSNGFRLDGVAENDHSGVSVSSAGDFNGDGFDDVIIGADDADPGGNSNSGSSYVVFGQADGFGATLNLSVLDGRNGFRLDGVAENDSSGKPVSSAGDINGDGFDDLIVGAAGADPNGSSSGSSYVVYGFATDISVDDTITGTAADEQINGALGNDTLDGGAGNDILIGGQGDDTLIYDAADTLRVDGGTGFDSLQLQNGDNLDLTAIANGLITNVEQIDLETDAASNTLILDTLDALALSDSSNDIFVLGTSDDTLTFAVGEFTPSAGGPQTVNGETYNVFVAADTDAAIFVDLDIVVTPVLT